MAGRACQSAGTVACVSDTHCDSCGRSDEPVAPVRRVYVTPERWDQEPKVEVVDDVESWCVVCQTHYPHQPVGADAADS
jgi:hypothetical protein